MIKIIDREKVETLVRNHPFSDIDEMRTFIDQVMHDLWKSKGRTTDTIRAGKHHRASV